jgi:hypothetical protein
VAIEAIKQVCIHRKFAVSLLYSLLFSASIVVNLLH